MILVSKSDVESDSPHSMPRGGEESLRRPGDPPAGATVRHPLVLASTSPRRRDLLAENGYQFTIVDPGIDDALLREPKGVRPDQWACSLAYLKASAAVRRCRHLHVPLSDETVVLGADTVVIKAGMLIGKPADAADAGRIIRLLRAGEHRVVTGVALLCPRTDRRQIFADTATVRFGELGDGAVDEYVASGNWRGKAGGYNLFERSAAGWPLNWEGDPTAIVGLPVAALRKALSTWSSGHGATGC